MKYDYPQPCKVEVGCKVMWYYYDKQSDAKKASKIAIKHGAYKASQGFDFGYQSVGSINFSEPEKMYVVVLP